MLLYLLNRQKKYCRFKSVQTINTIRHGNIFIVRELRGVSYVFSSKRFDGWFYGRIVSGIQIELLTKLLLVIYLENDFEEGYPLPMITKYWLETCSSWLPVNNPPPPGTYETYFILFLRLVQIWKLDASIAKLGWTTCGTPFSKWPPSKLIKPTCILFCYRDLSQHEKWIPPSPNWDGLHTCIWRHVPIGRQRSEISLSPITQHLG